MENQQNFTLFLSYSAKDSKQINQLSDGLLKNGINVYHSRDQLITSKNREETITDALLNADGVVVLITQNSIESFYAKDEVEHVSNYFFDPKPGQLIIPVIYGDIEPPISLMRYQAIYWKENSWQVVDEITKAVHSFKQVSDKRSYEQETIIEEDSGHGGLEDGDNRPGSNFNEDQRPENFQSENERPGSSMSEEEQSSKPLIFISYEHLNDKEYFEKIRELLYNYEVNTFDFGYDISSVKVNYKELKSKVKKSEAFIAIYSNYYKENSTLKSQIDLAIDFKKPILFIKTNENINIDNNYYQYKSILFGHDDVATAVAQLLRSDKNKTVAETEKDTTKIYQPFILTEGNHQATDDQLDFENDIDSFASLIMLERVHPPLAIGLFGNWGSGKSFFMEKLSERMKDKEKSNDPDFIKNVVHVKFNSWHYSDTNLWASLITQIFNSLIKYSKDEKMEDELKKLMDTLEYTSLQKKAVEEKRKEVEANINKLKEEQKRKRERLEDLSGIALLKLILSNEKIKESYSELNNNNIESIIQDTEKINGYIDEVKDWNNQFRYYFREFKNLKGGRWIFVLAVALLVPLGVFVLTHFKIVDWDKLTLGLSVKISAIAAFIGNIFRPVRAIIKSYFQALKRLDSMKNTIQSRKVVSVPELTENETILSELEQSLNDINLKIESTQNEIDDILSGRQLLKFLEQRSRDERYANQLGLISWIYNDFNTLDELLRKQHQLTDEEKAKLINPQGVKLQIDRIVLYIDDLDRCNEDVVVKVLEAVHLLLALPLFVVVVGVDPRWLNNALTEKYKNLFGNKSEEHPTTDNKNKELKDQQAQDLNNQKATSYDYLEKIFQIPFALKPINKTGRDKLIKYLIRDELNPSTVTNVKVTGSAPKEKTTITNVSDGKKGQSGTTIPDIKPGSEAEVNNLKTHKITKERLVFTTAELEYMQKISPIFGKTPRSINRYINIYRIIRSHGSLNVDGEYSEEEYKPVMFLLGFIVGYSAYAKEFVDEISKSSDSLSFNTFIEKGKLNDDIKKLIKSYVAEINNLTMKDFKRNLELISRFSFRTILTEP